MAVGVPELARTELAAAAGARVTTDSSVRCAKRPVLDAYYTYACPQALWTRWHDQMVAGATPAMSPGGGGIWPRWESQLEGERSSGVRGKERGAHGGCYGGLGELGEGMMRSCGRRRSRGRDDEDGGVEGEAGRPASCELTERRERWRWSPWTARRGEGVSVATGTAGGGGGGARAREGERTRGGEKHGREVEGVRASSWR